MITPFFLSYARKDGDERLLNFYLELNKALSKRLSSQDYGPGFLDRAGIQGGERWDEELTDALQTSRVFIPVYSQSYFDRPICGKEWMVFRLRQEAYLKRYQQVERPRVILPVIWSGEHWLPKPLPYVARTENYRYGPSEAREACVRYGLWNIQERPRLRHHFREFVAEFADSVATAVRAQEATKRPLPAVVLPPFDEIPNAFDLPDPETGVDAEAALLGPRHVRFVFVVATESELKSVGEQIGAHGRNPLQWHPYRPDSQDEVAVIAQEVVRQRQLQYHLVLLDDNLVKRLEQAERNKNLIVMVVDPWTLQLAGYFGPASVVGEREELQCLVMVPLNPGQVKTPEARKEIDDALTGAFYHRRRKNPSLFLNPISSASDFRVRLEVALEAMLTARQQAGGLPEAGGKAPPVLSLA